MTYSFDVIEPGSNFSAIVVMEPCGTNTPRSPPTDEGKEVSQRSQNHGGAEAAPGVENVNEQDTGAGEVSEADAEPDEPMRAECIAEPSVHSRKTNHRLKAGGITTLPR